MDYDLFICHASEDKEEIVRPLADALAERGRRVWLDELEIRLGDSLRQRIDAGLADSRFALVVLSPAFFSKRWPQWELDGLAQREMLSRQKVVLPVWHRVTVDDVAVYSPPLAGRRAALTEHGLAAVVEEVEAVFSATEPHAGSGGRAPAQATRETADARATRESFLVLAPPSEHRVETPHRVTPPPQVIWAQTIFVHVENVGAGIALIRNAGADPVRVGTVTVRPPTAISPGASRPVELIVSTMTEDIRLPAGELVRFWLDYGDASEADRRLWAVARYDGGGGWTNVGSDNRSLTDPSVAVVPGTAERTRDR